MQQAMKSTHGRLPLSFSASLLVTTALFVNGCLVAEMFHQDTRWLLGKETLEAAARGAAICVALVFVVSLILLFGGSFTFRKRFGWRSYFQSTFLLANSLLLLTLGLLAQSRAFVQYFARGMFAMHGSQFFLWALLPFAGFLMLCRSLDMGASRKPTRGSVADNGDG